MDEINKVPALRFPEFEEQWIHHNLGEVANLTKGKGISKVDISIDGSLACIRYGELYTHYGETISTIRSRTHLKVDDCVLSEANDVIIPASGETQLDIATASCVLIPGVALGGDLNIIKSPIDGVFLSFYLNNKKKLEIAALAQGISVVHLYAGQLRTLNLNIPSDREQRKIAAFLTAVDDKIQLLTKKKALLEKYKKGVMQQIFSQEIRFKDDNGCAYPHWQEKTLWELCLNIRSGKTKPELKGEFPVYGSTGVIGRCTLPTHSGKFILIARVGANAGSLNFVSGDFSVTDNTLIIQVESSASSEFMFYLLANCKLGRLVFGSGQPLITAGQLKALILSSPAFEEQIKIANFLSALDHKITHVDQQVELSKQYKKGLLQQMFV
jgi:type I restriction enzyme S subunit